MGSITIKSSSRIRGGKTSVGNGRKLGLRKVGCGINVQISSYS